MLPLSSPLTTTTDRHGCRHYHAPLKVLSFEQEKDLLESWADFMREVDCDMITGYNIMNFDIPCVLSLNSSPLRRFFSCTLTSRAHLCAPRSCSLFHAICLFDLFRSLCFTSFVPLGLFHSLCSTLFESFIRLFY